MSRTLHFSLVMLAAVWNLAGDGCSQEAGGTGAGGPPTPAAAPPGPVVAGSAVATAAIAAMDEDDVAVPAAPFTDPQRNFDEVRKALRPTSPSCAGTCRARSSASA